MKINHFAVSLMKTSVAKEFNGGAGVGQNKDLAFLKDFFAGNTTSEFVDACPVAGLFNARILNLSEDIIEVEYEAGRQLLQGAGVIQGGQISSMLDFAMALLALSRLEEYANISTISLSTDFHRPATEGTYIAKASITKKGRTVIFTAATLINADGKSIATATASSMITAMTRD